MNQMTKQTDKPKRFCDALIVDELVKTRHCLLSQNRCKYTDATKHSCRIYQDYYGDRK